MQGTSSDQTEAILARVPLFQSLPASELNLLANSLHPVEVSAGEILFREGDHGEHFYIVIEGQIEILKALATPDEHVLAVRGPGDFIGEMSLLNAGGLRTASVRSQGQARLLEMTRADFDQMLDRHPQLAYEMVRVLSNRLNVSHNRAMREIQEKNRQLLQAYEDLKAAQAQLIEKEKLERELQLAYEIQMSTLPQSLPQMAGFDFGALMIPARAVGGDFFDFIPMSGDRMGIVVGDVADKGVPAAIFMAQTNALLHAEANHEASPRETLRRVNRHLLARNAKSLFVTLLFGILEANTRQFAYARAGHNLPLIYHPDGEVISPPMEIGQFLGVLDEPLLDEQVIDLQPGSALLLYTDGATDAFAPQGGVFGVDNLVECLKSTIDMRSQDICQSIYQALRDYHSGTPQFDDVTLVAVKSV